ncbi:hypothetical protein LTR95_004697 [Oleoguttula sp. CCFEE 5521]
MAMRAAPESVIWDNTMRHNFLEQAAIHMFEKEWRENKTSGFDIAHDATARDASAMQGAILPKAGRFSNANEQEGRRISSRNERTTPNQYESLTKLFKRRVVDTQVKRKSRIVKLSIPGARFLAITSTSPRPQRIENGKELAAEAEPWTHVAAEEESSKKRKLDQLSGSDDDCYCSKKLVSTNSRPPREIAGLPPLPHADDGTRYAHRHFKVGGFRRPASQVSIDISLPELSKAPVVSNEKGKAPRRFTLRLGACCSADP